MQDVYIYPNVEHGKICQSEEILHVKDLGKKEQTKIKISREKE